MREMGQVERIYTSRDAAKARDLAEYKAERRAAIKEARASVRKWERKVDRFGGAVHIETLGRMRQRLADAVAA